MSSPRVQDSRIARWTATAGVAWLLTILLSGCSDPGVKAGVPNNRTSSTAGSTPNFSGPWASNFVAAYEAAQSDFERSVLEDEEITDQELSETLDRFTTCLEAYGHYDIKVAEDSSFHFQSPDGAKPEETDKQVSGCSIESGERHIASLHAFVRRNPDNLDEDTIMSACLVRKKAVDPSYSASDFALDAPGQTFPYLSGHGASDFTDCNADPLGLFD